MYIHTLVSSLILSHLCCLIKETPHAIIYTYTVYILHGIIFAATCGFKMEDQIDSSLNLYMCVAFAFAGSSADTHPQNMRAFEKNEL